MKVIITTSGLGSRLKNLTKDMNKSLIRIGNKFSICYIIEKFDPKTTEFIITLGFKGDLVKEFLIITYENYNFTFIEIDNYDNIGSSLLYSLSKTETYLQSPFIFFCCDSIIIDDININEFNNKNYLFVSKYNDSINYASVNVFDNKIININKKGCNQYDYIYIGVAYIYNFKEFWNNLKKIYNNDYTNNNLSDIDVYKSLINKYDFNYKIIDYWYDSGNLESLSKAKEIINCDYEILDKEHESICFTNNKVIKYSNNINQNKNKIFRGNILYPNVPKILNSGNNFYSMEYINGVLLSKCYSYGHIYKLLNWAYKNLWINEKIDNNFTNICKSFYKEKTLDRIKQIKNKFNFKDYYYINNNFTNSIELLLEKLNWNSLYTNKFYNFHGDFILDNILYSNDTYKLLDWRQDFGNELLYGDMYYDLAKLRHNIIFNHQNINNKLYSIDIDNDININIDLKCNYFLIQQLDDFDKFINEKKLNLNKIKILTSLIWINMSPLHEYEISKFLFYFGKYNLSLLL